MTIVVRRAGATARYWTGNGYSVTTGFDKSYPYLEGSAVINFQIASKGGGETQIQVLVGADSFEEIAKHMLIANPEKAIRAFGNTLQDFRSESIKK